MTEIRPEAGQPEGQPGPRPSLDDPGDRSHFWSRSMRGWDLAFYLMTGLTAVAILILQEGADVPTAVALGLLAVLVVAYVLIGRRAALTDNPRLVAVYLAVLLVVVTAVSAASIAGSVLLFIGFSQIWFFAPNRRTGVVLVVVLAVGVFTAIGLRSGIHTAADLGALLTQGGVTVAFAVLLGLWVTQIAERSEERAQLVERLEAAQEELGRTHHTAGVMAERERMAQEIHDTLAQGFTSIVMLSQAVRADVERGRTSAAVERLDLVERTARDNLAEARALVAAFAPVGLDDGGIRAALERLAARFGAETRISVEVALPDALPDLGREREVILLRAAQEALTNVRRHAEASSARLALAVGEGGALTLEVSDDGRGIDPEVVEGFGLRGMRDRVTSGGGELEVAARQEGGTRVLVVLPPGEVEQ
ncbi:sensor histidine kinase [Actinotalea sp. M2MS4P-6]|uniref:sensor histidine kinase n=1 Tax=Actinotalea sp. M2MS4P-6 TaxID=2983762 RepID=UPI0021E5024D|nr:sensor histidine kinase [Actinotalea sp. M2MS4P-6]MCV2395593.1 sensor histidine kinase [Actinotalea sp. M2MS4P-6]